MDSITRTLLEDTIRREGRSLLQYVSEAFPWTTPQEQAALGKIEKIVQEEQNGAGTLVRLLLKKRVAPPYLGAYPMVFTNLNYISLDHLRPLLVAYQKERITDLEAYVTRIADHDAAAAVRQILEHKRRHLQTLLNLQSPATPAAA